MLNGDRPADVYSVFTSAALNEVSNQGTQVTDEIAYAVGLYGIGVMKLGAAYTALSINLRYSKLYTHSKATIFLLLFCLKAAISK
ncbi:MAG: hypothetical protein DCF15_08925 [Phormidesmis priestleyi]|uniref:Uncharacterized protein n=1 Tax=Phormidesmis priestleyi TaxID=268141 RepID=A0A2W4XJR8_9CYAN|nr:MAG: hypothetical protein DCF15_08925 [Phormidesmis priestleyi]